MRFLDDFIWRSLSPQSRETLKAMRRIERIASRPGSIRSLRKRRPPEAGVSVPAVPPTGPLPKQGGAEAPLEFD